MFDAPVKPGLLPTTEPLTLRERVRLAAEAEADPRLKAWLLALLGEETEREPELANDATSRVAARRGRSLKTNTEGP